MRLLLLLSAFFASIVTSSAQDQHLTKPKLVVGLVIDQMRWDYLYRYNSLYGDNGFKRLLNEGFSCENTMVPYVPTYTAPGHTCIYTGSVPAINGMIGNNWFDRNTNKNIYCTDDSTVSTVGSNTEEGKMSPDNLWVTTITDELRLSNNFKSKVIGIALKDRASILPAGHTANAAYWFDDKAGKWISSTYYMKTLPAWVGDFNTKDLPGAYMSKDWNTLLPTDKYDVSTADDEPYENNIKGEKTVTFPHKLSSIGNDNKFSSFKTTPFANTFTLDFAKAAIENEKLGSNNVTDFLAISISSTDYIGHAFGPNSVEIEDTYLRLDKDIAGFLEYLDATIGKGNYLVFLSADHGAAHVPAFLNDHKIPAGTFSEEVLTKELNMVIETTFGLKNIVQDLQNYQVYLNINEIQKSGKDVNAVKALVIQTLKQKPYIVNAFNTDEIGQVTIAEPLKTRIINGYNSKRSGDIEFVIKPAYFEGGNKGTTHGLWNPYDAHIPLVWFGWKIPHGKLNSETYMTDIAPTIAALLQIQMPNGCVGKVITEVVK
ncbi:alkaline phosphatase PafA [Ferruginibacter albus]|uniref:alkaline phosphatase PafA n=1 Tax=Ferruginibacter albus TaxID=2875540 RepID=UPI001CC66320|nr:alkaline phosphatase PafA [Ferruginibacter albus]UAY51475.1 alkaline phosphatase family protein [Ferruginibacter albus]